MNTTQDYLPIKEVRDDLVVLKDGSVTCVIKTSAVNFGLLSENEQLAIISSFAGLLNSLSFSVQIVIRSKRLDISSYLEKLDEAKSRQNNPLLKEIMGRYRIFIESVIRENEVLDKQFYIIVSVSYLELGIINDINKHFQKATTILIPRRDHVIRQLERIGLRATQLNTEALIKLFYDIFNEAELEDKEPVVANIQPASLQPQQIENPQQKEIPKAQEKPVQPNQTLQVSVQPTPVTPPTPATPPPRTINRSVPFVVEELPDEYSSV